MPSIVSRFIARLPLAGALAVVLLLSLGCGDALRFAAAQGAVKGILIDNFGHPVAGASVRAVTGGDERGARTATSGADGSYTVGCEKGLVTLGFSAPTVLPASLTVSSPGTEIVTAPEATLVSRPPAGGIWIGSNGKYELVPWLPTVASVRQIPRGAGPVFGACKTLAPGGQMSAGDKQFYLFLQGKESADYRLVTLPKGTLWGSGACSEHASGATGVTARDLADGKVIHGRLAWGTHCVIKTDGGVHSERDLGMAACFYWRGNLPVVTGEAG